MKSIQKVEEILEEILKSINWVIEGDPTNEAHRTLSFSHAQKAKDLLDKLKVELEGHCPYCKGLNFEKSVQDYWCNDCGRDFHFTAEEAIEEEKG